MKKWMCPEHQLPLRTVEGYPGALCCPLSAQKCPTIFTVIDGHLCRDDGEQPGWTDVETGEKREVK